MRFVKGSISFFPKRGSRGVRAPNYNHNNTCTLVISENRGADTHRSYAASYQLDDLDKDPVVGGRRHEFKEEGCQGKVVLGIPSRQLTYDINRGRLHP